MKAKRFLIISLALVTVLVLSVSAVYAQDPGSGFGGGRGRGGARGGRGPDTTTMTPRGGNRGAVNGPSIGAFPGCGAYCDLPPASVDALPQDVVDLMIDGWADEQHAYAVYAAVIEQFGAVRPFVNIQRAETQHAAAWEAMFERYGIETPEVPAFDLPTFTNLSEACAVAAEAEVANFDLYDTMLESFEPYPDLQFVAQNLRDASEFNHLPAFENCAAY